MAHRILEFLGRRKRLMGSIGALILTGLILLSLTRGAPPAGNDAKPNNAANASPIVATAQAEPTPWLNLLRLVSPSLDVEAPVEEVGIDEQNQIAVPRADGAVGWYKYSSKPGEKGLSIIDGHVDADRSAGVFRDLRNIKVGAIIEITYQNQQTHIFKVVDIRQVPVAEADKTLFSKRESIQSQLNLITCGGRYNQDRNTYDERVIVITERVDAAL